MDNIKITIDKKDFFVYDLTEADGVISGRSKNHLDTLKEAAKDGREIFIDDVSRGKITYTWFPISGHFQIYI